MPATVEHTRSVRSSTRVSILGSLLLAVVVIFASLVYMTRANIVSSELRAATEQAERLQVAAMTELDSLDRVAGDLSQTDLVQGLSAGATTPRRNELEYLFRQTGLHSVRVSGPDGTPYEWRTCPAGAARLASTPRYFVVDQDHLYAVVSKRIPAVGTAGREASTAVLVREIDLDSLATAAGVAAEELRLTRAESVVALGVLVRSSESSLGVELIRPHTLVVHASLPGQRGSVAGVLSAEVESVGYKGAPQLVGGTVAALVVVGLVWGAATIGLIERFSLSRVTWLKAAVSALAERKQEGVRLAVDGAASDEISEVAAEINLMLDSLEHARRSEQQAELFSRALIENMVDAVLVLDADGKIAFANGQAARMAGCEPSALQGRLYGDLFEISMPDSVERVLSGRIDADKLGIVEASLERPDGTRSWVELSVSSFSRLGRVEAIQLTARDVTERRELQQELVWLADHDHLTGLFNRKRFEEEVERELIEAARSGSGGALLWLDLDGFKTINDVHGHRAGDEVLRRFAQTLRENVRANHVVARIGGDEFAVLLSRTDPEEAERVAFRVLNAVRSNVTAFEGQSLRVTASLGIAMFPQDGSSITQLLARADIAMYQAKESGKATARRYTRDADKERLESGRQAWGARIEEALLTDRFAAYGQPIVDLATGEVARHELLVRLLEGERVVPPAEFLPHAEELGLINRVDSWMLDQAIALVCEGLDAGMPPHLSVNLSGYAFSDAQFVQSVYDRLDAHRDVCPYLGFEITETSLIRHMPVAAGFTERVKAMGSVMYLDDFGSGFSSFYYLRHLPVGVLKIDRELIRHVSRSDKDMRLVEGIVEMACGLGMSVVAEGVEDGLTADVLQGFGVRMAQGELFGMPVPIRSALGNAEKSHAIAEVGDAR